MIEMMPSTINNLGDLLLYSWQLQIKEIQNMHALEAGVLQSPGQESQVLPLSLNLLAFQFVCKQVPSDGLVITYPAGHVGWFFFLNVLGYVSYLF